MLSKLTIKNVALIEYAEINFEDGLNVLSGETGAGKSVILDSVNFVLGAKADKTMIRHGETECFVKAEFILPEYSLAVQTLKELDIDSDGEIIISRKFTDQGKNAIKINGNTVTATMLRSVTDSLVDVHGQSEHFFLLKESNQLKLLDNVIGEDARLQKQVLSKLLAKKHAVEQRIQTLGGNEQERSRRIDVLRFQIDEIQAVDMKEGEEDELLAKRNKMHNLEKIITSINETNGALTEEYGVLNALRSASRAMGAISKLDQAYASIYERIQNLIIETDDVAETLTDFADELYFDENEAESIENRLDDIKTLKRKYGADKKQIDEYLENIKDEYDLLSDCEGQYALLTAEKTAILDETYQTCTTLTKIRKQQAKAFCARVIEELKTLNIPHAQFDVQFNEYDKTDVENATTNGLDSITFLFSANAGEPMKPLGKIISGGEMSRFMLAIKTQLSKINEISTYIFDEIDAGISGKTAKVVGEKLAKISKDTQVIAVSHLAQIAVLSDVQLLIEKQEHEDKTLTNVYPLDEEGKRKEIMRLLSGDEYDEIAKQHAEELIKQAKEYKKAI